MISIKKIEIERCLVENFNEPVNVYYVIWFKFILGVLYLWKLLSRDFSNISFWPDSVLSGYPIDIYSQDYILTTGVPPLFDIVTFHFVHYVLPFPNSDVLSLLQFCAIGLSFLLIFALPKYSRLIAIFLYIIVSYLWGFVFRLGQDIDAVFLVQGSLLVYCLLPYEASIEYYKKLRFLVLCIFVLYYFFSGVNKIVDLSYEEWLKFDLVNINSSFHLRYLAENFEWTPKLPELDSQLLFGLNLFGALITYVVHLGAPILLFSAGTRKVLFYWFFYSLFHFLTIYLGILFSMNFLAWLLVLPVYRWFHDFRK